MAKHGSSFVQSQRKEKSPIRGLMPIMGLSLALLLAVMAYFLAGPILDWARSNDGRIGQSIADIDASVPEDWPANTLNFVLAGLMWLVFFGIAMTFVAAAIGTDPEKMAFKDMPVSSADRKGSIKQMKKDLKEAKRRQRERDKNRR